MFFLFVSRSFSEIKTILITSFRHIIWFSCIPTWNERDINETVHFWIDLNLTKFRWHYGFVESMKYSFFKIHMVPCNFVKFTIKVGEFVTCLLRILPLKKINNSKSSYSLCNLIFHVIFFYPVNSIFWLKELVTFSVRHVSNKKILDFRNEHLAYDRFKCLY